MTNLRHFLMQEQIIKAIRGFFYIRDFHEVITPILNEAVPNEPNLYPFTTDWKTIDGQKTFFLPMSPERNLKLMLAKGIGNCFSLGKSFRNLENSGTLHSPEFLMLEWYRENADYKKIMEDIQELLVALNSKFFILNLPKKWPVFSLTELFKQYAKLDLVEIINDKKKLADYDKIFVNEIESRLPRTPLFLIDFPAKISPLCKPQKDKPYLADRFEFYINGIELGNGNTENTDYLSVRKVFEKQQKKNGYPIDEEFLNALKTMNETGKSYAGIGVGIDRLVNIITSNSSEGDNKEVCFYSV